MKNKMKINHVDNDFGEEIPILLDMNETAALINSKWDRRLLNVYIKRGWFIEPSFLISGKKYWSQKRVNEYIKKCEEEENVHQNGNINRMKIVEEMNNEYNAKG